MRKEDELLLCDSHCHFFSTRFLEILARDVAGLPDTDRAPALAARLGWDAPGPAEALADRWIEELDRSGVARSVLIASVPGDEESVAVAVARHPSRFVGAFMFNPIARRCRAEAGACVVDAATQDGRPLSGDAPLQAG